MTNRSWNSLKMFEVPIVAIGAFPYDGLWRAAVGFVMMPFLLYLGFDNRADCVLLPFLLAVLLVMRFLPAIARRLGVFSITAQEIWAERRSLARSYDSYQWQKLFYIGVGLAVYIVVSGSCQVFRLALCLFCLVSGSLGLIRWRVVDRCRTRGEHK